MCWIWYDSTGGVNSLDLNSFKWDYEFIIMSNKLIPFDPSHKIHDLSYYNHTNYMLRRTLNKGIWKLDNQLKLASSLAQISTL